MLSRSRAGKELTAPLEESGSDDEYDSDGEGAYGPLGGLAALSVPVVSIGASSAEALLAAMGAGQAVRTPPHRFVATRANHQCSPAKSRLLCAGAARPLRQDDAGGGVDHLRRREGVGVAERTHKPA